MKLLVIFLIITLKSLNPIFAMPDIKIDRPCNLDYLTFFLPELWLTKQSVSLSELGELAPKDLVYQWKYFLEMENVNMYLRLDRITGKPSIISGEGIPWIEVPSNNVPLERVEALARDFLCKYPNLFNINPSLLKTNIFASGPISDYLYNIRFDFYYSNIPVEKSHLSFHLNHGSLVQFGQEFICDSIYELNPEPTLSIGDAWKLLWDYVGGLSPKDVILDNGGLSIIPISTEEVLEGKLVPIGKGLKYRLVYTLVFYCDDPLYTWEAKIDAHTGEILSFCNPNSIDP